jgi:hypothetical protein
MSSPQPASSSPFAIADLTGSWTGLNLPSVTIASLLEAQHKNAAALGSANQAALDGLKTLLHRQGALLAASVDTYNRVTSDLLAADSFEERAAKQADATRDAYVSIVARFRDLSDIVIEANTLAIGIVNARILEAFGELQALFAPPAALPAASGEAPPPPPGEPAAVLEDAIETASIPVEPSPAPKHADAAVATAVVAVEPDAAPEEAVATVEPVIDRVEPDAATATAASTIAPEAVAPQAEAIAATTPPPEAVTPDSEAAAAAAPSPRKAAKTAAKSARTTAPVAPLPKTSLPRSPATTTPPPKASPPRSPATTTPPPKASLPKSPTTTPAPKASLPKSPTTTPAPKSPPKPPRRPTSRG